MKQGNIYEYVPIGNYCIPPIPTVSLAENTFKSLKNFFAFNNNKHEEMFKGSEQDLFVLPDRLEKFVAPDVNLKDLSDALGECLEGWLENHDTKNYVTYVVGQHCSKNSEILRLWAENNDACVISPPSSEDIFSDFDKLSFNLPEEGRIWVIPELEKYFIRHVNGLKKIRKLLHLAENGELGKGVIGCHSFPWAYLQMVLKLPLKNSITLQSFDGEKLIRMIAASSGGASYTKFKFLNISNGRKIGGTVSKNEAADPLITKIAAYCRGNIFLSLKFWKDSLRLENNSSGHNDLIPSVKKGLNETLIWVIPDISEPVFSSVPGDESVIILHTIMLHGSISHDILIKILPFSKSSCKNMILDLLNSGFLKKRNNELSVSESAFFKVRKLFFERDYLVDKF
ncbi:MAG: hypothetical protein H6680_04800 [Desulfobacteraceae bacterium]|nr:hypothetical protein [Desulfobacteraceae bacterium]